MNDNEEKLLVSAAAIAGAYFFVIKPVLANFGVDPQSTATVQAINTAEPETNPFSLYFEPYIEYLQSTWGNDGQQKDLQLMQSLKANYDQGLYDNYSMGSSGNLKDIAIGGEILWSAFSFWHNGRINDVKAVFANLPDQLSVTLLTAYIFANYQADLLTYLKSGSNWWIPFHPRNGMNDTELAEIINHIEVLPQVK